MNKDLQHQRIKLWCDVYVAYVRSDNSTAANGAVTWADTALKRFDERFVEKEDKPSMEATDAKVC